MFSCPSFATPSTKFTAALPDLEVTEWVPVPGHPDHQPLVLPRTPWARGHGRSNRDNWEIRVYALICVNFLDGYEPLELRKQKQMRERGLEVEYQEKTGNISRAVGK